MRDIEVHGDQLTFNGTSQFLDTNGNVLQCLRQRTGTRLRIGWRGLAVYLRCRCGDTTNQGASAPNAALSTGRVCAHHKYSE